MNALQQTANGGSCLDLYYHYQYVQNEELEQEKIVFGHTEYTSIKHLPLLEKTMTGTIYIGDKAVPRKLIANDT